MTTNNSLSPEAGRSSGSPSPGGVTAAPCRLCASVKTRLLLDFGLRPFVSRFASGSGGQSPAHRLALSACPGCGLAQLDRPASPGALFNEYAWRSAWTSPSLYEAIAEMLAEHLPPGSNPGILDVGANDGTLLCLLRARGFTRLLGVEPCRGPLEEARANGLDMVQEFFGPESAKRLMHKRGPFQALACARVLQHVEDLAGFQAAVRGVLAPGGLALFHMADFDAHMDALDYGFITELSLNYFTLDTTRQFMAGCGLEPLAVKRLTGRGETLLVIGRKTGEGASPAWNPAASPSAAFERAVRFAAGWEGFKRSLHREFEACATGRAALYGVGAHSVSLAALAGLGGRFAYAVDDQPAKQGQHIPALGVGVRPASALAADPVDTVVLGLPSEHEEKVIRACLKLCPATPRFFSILPPSPRLPSFWRSR